MKTGVGTAAALAEGIFAVGALALAQVFHHIPALSLSLAVVGLVLGVEVLHGHAPVRTRPPTGRATHHPAGTRR